MAKKLDDLFYTLEMRDKQFIEETSKIRKSLEEIQKEMGEKMQKNIKNTEKTQDGFFKRLQQNWLKILAIMGTVKKAWDFTKEAAKFNQQVQALERQFGVSADKILGKLREVSQGTISDQGLIEATNRAFALNVTNNVDDLAKLMEFARLRARALGLDTTQAFNDIVTGIGRGSPLILDNLGIVTKAWTAEAQATGQAVDSQFILQKVLQQANVELGRQGELVLTDAEKFAVLQSKVENIKLALGQALLQGFRPLLDSLININTEGDTFKNTMDTISGIVNGVSNVIVLLSNVIQIVMNSFKAFFAGIEQGFLEIKLKILEVIRDIVEAAEKTGLGKRFGVSSSDINKNLTDTARKFEAAKLKANKAMGEADAKTKQNVENILNLFKEQVEEQEKLIEGAKQINNEISGAGGINEGLKETKKDTEDIEKNVLNIVSEFANLGKEVSEGNEKVSEMFDFIGSAASSYANGGIAGLLTYMLSIWAKIFKTVAETNSQVQEEVNLFEVLQNNIDNTNNLLATTEKLIQAWNGDEEALARLAQKRVDIIKQQNKESAKSLMISTKTAKSKQANIDYEKQQITLMYQNGKITKAQFDKSMMYQDAKQRRLDSEMAVINSINSALELNADGTIKNLKAFEELILNETDPERKEILESILENNISITDELEKQKNLIGDIKNEELGRIRQEIALGILDPQNIRDIQSIQSRLSAAGLSGLDLGTSLQGLGISGTNLTRSIGSITTIFNGIPTSDLTQQTAEAINNTIEGV